MNKFKIINDPVHGMIRFRFELLYDIIDHEYFQRLRRIKQMGFSNLVYPGANHTRFEHAIGATYLMTKALDILKAKGVEITEKEYLASCIAILCHDIGHGPFSHALEYDLLPVSHEELSILLLQQLETEFGSPIDLALEIFQNTYEKKFLCQLVSSQLDVDRLDYLTRDSFYTGVIEGRVGYDRILMMLDVKDYFLVVEEKGMSSIQKFLLSRHMMYSQVYMHKTALSAEQMLKMFIKRAKKCLAQGIKVELGDNILKVLSNSHRTDDNTYKSTIQSFMKLDDIDILDMLKKNEDSEDLVLKILSQSLLKRKLFKVYLPVVAEEQIDFEKLFNQIEKKNKIGRNVVKELFIGIKDNLSIYSNIKNSIHILRKDGLISEFSEMSDFIPKYTPKQKITYVGPKEDLRITI